jgi:hypothetical protein
MEKNQVSTPCQIYCVPQIAQPASPLDVITHLYGRVKRFVKRRLIYLSNRFSLESQAVQAETAKPSIDALPLQAGERVRIRSKAEIQATLDHWNSLKGCTFLEEMWPYCGTSQRVQKRMERFLDERDYRLKRTSGSVLLEGVICNGTVDFGKCDRSCFFFWREEWLERID